MLDKVKPKHTHKQTSFSNSAAESNVGRSFFLSCLVFALTQNLSTGSQCYITETLGLGTKFGQ